MVLQSLVLATLVYSDIFDYPLTFDEIHHNLIFQKTSKSALKIKLKKLVEKKKLIQIGPFYTFPKRERLVIWRKQRTKYSQKKIEKAKIAAKILSLIPTAGLIGISGAVAVGNSPANDDIDFFVITKAGSLFTTRFFCNLFLDCSNLRRKPDGKKVSDKICLNMFLAENDLEITPRDLYLAHEVLQLKPIFERDGTYQKFLAANSWVFKFLPNWSVNAKRKMRNVKRKNTRQVLVIGLLVKACENFLKLIQLKHMEKRRTAEVISDTKLLFHPEDVHQKVLEEFKRRLREYNVPLGKVL